MEGPGVKAYEVVLDWIESRILSGELVVGDVLPAERELARQLEVSRSAVREAVRALQAQGVVKSSVGAGSTGGTTITAVPAGALVRFLRLHVALARFPFADVMETRIALERLSGRLAAAHATPGDLSVMREALAQMDDAGADRVLFNDWDTALHVAIAEAAGNRLTADLTVAIRESLRLPLRESFTHVPDWDDLVRTLQADHRDIYLAISTGQAEEAADLLERHVRWAWERLRAGFPQQ